MSARHQMAGLIMTGQRFATLSNLDMQQCPKMFCNFVQKVLAKNTDIDIDVDVDVDADVDADANVDVDVKRFIMPVYSYRGLISDECRIFYK
jgi:hypothetical protein